MFFRNLYNKTKMNNIVYLYLMVYGLCTIMFFTNNLVYIVGGILLYVLLEYLNFTLIESMFIFIVGNILNTALFVLAINTWTPEIVLTNTVITNGVVYTTATVEFWNDQNWTNQISYGTK